MNGDLIYREDTLSALKGVIARTGLYGVSIEVILANIPAVEAEPVVHAHWEVVHGVLTPGGDPLLRCPRCRSRESEHLGGIECDRPHWNYCPHCGAHMDEEVVDA